MIKFLKFNFNVSVLSLIVISLFPGSLIGWFLHGDLGQQPDLIKNPYGTTLNHFIAYFFVSLFGFGIYLKNKNFKKLVFILFFLSIILEILQFIIPILGMIGIFPSLANSLIVGTVAFTVFITMYYGLHGKYFTTLMLEHMPWVISPDKFLPFFWLWINAIVAGLLNAFEVNAFWYFVNLFFIFLLPSLFIGTKVQEKHGLRVQKKDDYFDD